MKIYEFQLVDHNLAGTMFEIPPSAIKNFDKWITGDKTSDEWQAVDTMRVGYEMRVGYKKLTTTLFQGARFVRFGGADEAEYDRRCTKVSNELQSRFDPKDKDAVVNAFLATVSGKPREIPKEQLESREMQLAEGITFSEEWRYFCNKVSKQDQKRALEEVIGQARASRF